MPSPIFGYQPRVYRAEIVAELGSLNQAAVLQQLHYWLDPVRVTKEHAGHKWVYKTYEEWGSELGMTAKQARGALINLRAAGLVISIRNPNYGYDRTLWWRIDEEKLEARMSGS